MLHPRHRTTVVGFVKAAGWTTRLRWALPALLLGVVPGAVYAGPGVPATRPASAGRDVPPALSAEVETVEADATPAAAPVRRGPSTRPAGAVDGAGAPARADRPERRRLMGNPADMSEMDAYLYASTGRGPDDPYRLTDPLLYSTPWGHPAPPPYPPPPPPSRNPYGYGGGWYGSSSTARVREVQRIDGGAAPGGPTRAIRIQNPGGGLGARPGSIALPPSPRGPLPPGTSIPRARPPQLRPGT